MMMMEDAVKNTVYLRLLIGRWQEALSTPGWQIEEEKLLQSNRWGFHPGTKKSPLCFVFFSLLAYHEEESHIHRQALLIQNSFKKPVKNCPYCISKVLTERPLPKKQLDWSEGGSRVFFILLKKLKIVFKTNSIIIIGFMWAKISPAP